MSEIKQKKRNNTNTWLSILAVLVSFGAFGVSIYEAGIMREQQKIMYQEQQLMLEQQKISVWPYLESDINYSYQKGKTSITYKIRNKGIGPAKIDQAKLYVNDSTLNDYNQIWDFIVELIPEKLDGDVSFSFQPPSGVLSPEEDMTWLSINIPRFENDMEIIRNLELSFEICYCSVYNDCWTLLSNEREPVEGCNDLKKE